MELAKRLISKPQVFSGELSGNEEPSIVFDLITWIPGKSLKTDAYKWFCMTDALKTWLIAHDVASKDEFS